MSKKLRKYIGPNFGTWKWLETQAAYCRLKKALKDDHLKLALKDLFMSQNNQFNKILEAEKARAVEEAKYHLEMIILSCDDSTLGSVYVSFDKKAACSGRSLDDLGFEYRKRLSKLLQGKKRNGKE